MLPLLGEVEPPRGAVAVPVPLKAEFYKSSEDSPYLMNEFEKVYYELNHGTLTPPQSPPSEQPIITTLEPLLGSYHHIPKPAIYSVPEKQLVPEELNYPVVPIQTNVDIPVDNYASMSTPQPDIARELAVVDELIRTRVEDMQWSTGPSSPESSSTSNFGDCSSDDPEWVPEPIENHNNNTSYDLVAKTLRKKSKPYSVAPSDKKNRKKEQNKNAATRYRMKKKAEVEEILSEEKGLLDTHGELNNQITDLQREIKYLKGLMRDLFKAKGIIN
jgi:cyclic AMP-dependent transcription factor ATF-4